MGIHPQAGSHEFSSQAIFIQQLFHAAGIFFDFLFRHVIHIRNRIVIMELNRGESQFGKFREFCLQVDWLTGFRTIGIRSGMNVPGAY